MSTATLPTTRAHWLGRIAAAILGSYAFTWGFIALGTAGMYAAGMEFHDSEFLSALLGLLGYLGLFCWAFVARNLTKVWLVLLGGGLVMTGAAELVKRAIVAAAGGV